MVISINNLYPLVRLSPCGDYWRLKDVIKFIIDDKDFEIPYNFLTDFASVPDWIQLLIFNDKTKFNIAAIVHDYLYANKLLNRKTCDEVFYQLCLKCGISKYKAYLMWLGVRAGGWWTYDRIVTYGQVHVECVYKNECNKLI